MWVLGFWVWICLMPRNVSKPHIRLAHVTSLARRSPSKRGCVPHMPSSDATVPCLSFGVEATAKWVHLVHSLLHLRGAPPLIGVLRPPFSGGGRPSPPFSALRTILPAPFSPLVQCHRRPYTPPFSALLTAAFSALLTALPLPIPFLITRGPGRPGRSPCQCTPGFNG